MNDRVAQHSAQFFWFSTPGVAKIYLVVLTSVAVAVRLHESVQPSYISRLTVIGANVH